eukprot:gene36715-47862_t
MDRFEAMNAFLAVADHQGFASAARHLGLSTSAITRYVAALEGRLGVRLLNRTTRAINLTDAGQQFLERSRRILADLGEAEQMVESERAEARGRFVLSAPLVFGRLHVAPLMCEYLTYNPKVSGELTLTDRAVHLVEDGIDLAIRIGHLGDSSDIVRKAGTVRRVLVASPAYLERHGSPASPADLKHHVLIGFTALTHPTLWRFIADGHDLSIAVSPRYITNSADAAIWHAEQNGGIVMALSYQVADAVRAGRLCILLPDFEPEPYPIQLVYPHSRLLSVRVRTFIDYALATRDWHQFKRFALRRRGREAEGTRLLNERTPKGYRGSQAHGSRAMDTLDRDFGACTEPNASPKCLHRSYMHHDDRMKELLLAILDETAGPYPLSGWGSGHIAALVVVGALQALWLVLHSRRFADAARPRTWPLLMTLLCFGSFAIGYMIMAALWSSPEIQQEAFRTAGAIAGAGQTAHHESNALIIEGGRAIARLLGTAGAVVLSGVVVTTLAGVAALSGGFSLFALLLPSRMRGVE